MMYNMYIWWSLEASNPLRYYVSQDVGVSKNEGALAL